MRHVPAAFLSLGFLIAAPAAFAEGTLLRPLASAAPSWSSIPPGPHPLLADGGSPGQQCRAAIQAAEQAAGIPRQLMAAIGRVESGRSNGSGGVDPWPWSINVEGVDHVYDTKVAALAGVRAFQASGARSIDVGCMQVNLMFHPDAFASLEQAFDPRTNAQYAARFLTQLFAKTGSWPAATAAYHSGTPELGAAYQRKVAAIWPEEQRHADVPATMLAGAAIPAWGATPGGIGSGAGGAFMLSNRSEAAHIIPMGAGALSRGLDAYRSAPIAIVSRQAIRSP